jgi:hypothetical protein
MNKLVYYKSFINESKEDIHSICKKYFIGNYNINEDGTIDVDGDVDLTRNILTKLTKLPLKFRKVSGNFYCYNNQLTSLEGAPREVGDGFYCYNNQLTSLEGAPREVGGHFNCSNNELRSLSGAPREVGGDFYCYENQLSSLSGISKYISGGIYCYNNQLRDVKGVKDGWRGGFSVKGNPVYQIFKLFPPHRVTSRKERWDEVIEFLNEHEVIRDGKVVVLAALELVFHEMGLEVPEIDQIEGYEIQY